jgi:hypothetical protein
VIAQNRLDDSSSSHSRVDWVATRSGAERGLITLSVRIYHDQDAVDVQRQHPRVARRDAVGEAGGRRIARGRWVAGMIPGARWYVMGLGERAFGITGVGAAARFGRASLKESPATRYELATIVFEGTKEVGQRAGVPRRTSCPTG